VALPAAPAVAVSSLPDGGLEGLVGLAFDASGRLIGTDAVTHSVVRIAPDGTVTRVAGGQEGLVDGAGAAAAFSAPLGVVGDTTGNLYVADWNNHAIRKLTFDAAGEATVTTLAGGTAGFQDDRGAAARFRQPHGLALDASGRLVVSDQFNHAIRRVALDGTVTTVAGTGVAGHRDGPASTAQFSDPIGVAVAPDGTIYVSDRGNARIRMIAPDGMVSTLAGDGVNGDADGYGRFGRLHMAEGLAVLPDGRVVVADAENHKLKLLDPATGALVTLAGTGAGDFMDGPGLSAKFGGPRGVLVGRDGRLYVSDDYGSVRVVSGL
jgi:sugar lactone lactonase YvrE